ncbi:glycosyltransferase [Gammaproteobacteria bacterium]|nr:glycosyltransferase [Gammaproteobacteria bacterium]
MGSKKRYIFVHMLNDFSGSPRVLADFSMAEAIQHENISVVTSRTSGFLDSVHGERISFWYPRSKSNVFNFISFGLAHLQCFFIVFFLIMRSYFFGEKPIVLSNTLLSLSSMLVCRILRARSVVYVHELSIKPKLMHQIAVRVIEYCADDVIFVSKFLKKQFSFKAPLSVVIPNGLRNDFNDSNYLDFDRKFLKGKVLFVGSLKEYKGIFELITISKMMPEIIFSGILNCSDKELADFIRDNDIPRNLAFESRVDDLENRFRGAFLVLSLSKPKMWVETFGLTILEGMSCGCPCVVPPVGGHLDFFDSSCGLVADSADTKIITNFILKLKRDQIYWRECSNNSIEGSSKLSHQSFLNLVDEFWQETN